MCTVCGGIKMSDTLIRDNKNYGSVGEFLKDVIREGSATLEKIMQIKAKAENKILSFGRRAESAHKLLEALFSKPMVSIKGVQTITNLSPKAAGELVSLFVDNELLHEVSNQQRNRAFAFTEYLDLFMK